MRAFTTFAFVAIALTAASGFDQTTASNDWPQWRGPMRNGVSTETGLLQQWPEGGPEKAWSAGGVGAGYGGVSVAGAHVYVQGMRGRQSVVFALDRTKGAVVWSRPIGAAGNNDRGPGPRSTPTIDGDRVYALSETGDLACLRTSDGTILWSRNVLRDFKGQNPYWLLSESPLVDGDHVFVTPGGRDAGMVALHKATGQTVWTSRGLSDEPGYASPVIADIGQVRTIMTMTSASAVGVRAADGRVMWRYRPVANQTANVATPVVRGNQVFFTSGYGTGAALLTMSAQADEVRARETYFTQEMRNHHGGVVLVEGVVYGFDEAILAAVDFATGKRLWRHRSVGKGAVTYADQRLYILGENNTVGLAQVTPAGYRPMGQFAIPDRGWPSWAHPVVSGGRLYIRNQDTVTAYNISAR
jgi:outer membrane protein assembly factor BamB